MKITIETPTKAVLSDFTKDDIENLRSQLTYTNTSVQFLLSKHSKNRFFKASNPKAWQERLVELKSQLKDCILKFDNGYWIRPGIIPYISGINIEVVNNVEYTRFSPIPWASKPGFEPYQYQQQSMEKLMEIRHGSISIPTGAGKSLILLMLARNMGLDTVVVTPSKSIFNELLVEFEKRLGKKYVGGYGDGKKDIKKKITIVIGKSLTMLKEDSKAYEFFRNKKAMLVDESHSFAASQLESVCHGVLSNIPNRFFVSATQTRGDGTEKMLHSIIGKTVLEMSLEDAINQGYLCPLKFTIVSLKSPLKRDVKDPLECKRKHFLYNDEVAKFYANVANASWNVKQESTLILVEELRQIQAVIKYLKVPFSYIHSGNKKDSAKWGLEETDLQNEVDRFNNGDVRVLIGTRSISTGTNIYPTHNTCNFVGGSSEILTKQGTMGRSTRKLEISKYADKHKSKPYSMIWDVKILDQPILDNHLSKRIEYYKESGGSINFPKL